MSKKDALEDMKVDAIAMVQMFQCGYLMGYNEDKIEKVKAEDLKVKMIKAFESKFGNKLQEIYTKIQEGL